MASRREVVVATENYLRSKGYNNSTGKYDRVIMGVKSLLGETLLAYGSPEFERAIQQETERMLKKYVKDSAMEYDPVMCMMVHANDAVPELRNNREKVWSVGYQLNGVRVTQSIGVIAESANEAIKKAEEHLSKKGWVHIFGASQSESLETMKRKGKPVIDERTVDKDGMHIIEYVDIDGDKQKQTIKGTAAEANKRIEELKRHGCKITKTRMFANWDNAIQAIDAKVNDASRVIKQRNGYTLGINGNGTIYLAFPGETENNPHMYLGKENDKNLNDAKILFEKFASTKDSAMVYDEVMAMMKPITVNDQKTTDFSSGEAKKVFEYIDRHVTKDMNDYPREIERAKTSADCERLENSIRASLDDAVDEYIQIWNEVGLYAQKRKNEIVDRYGKLMSQAFKKYNELKARE